MREKQDAFKTKKSLGQNFLNNIRIPELMAEAGGVEEGDFVLEIGPGIGALTKELLKKGATVVAIEADHRAIQALEGSFESEIQEKKLTVVHGDVRKVNLNELGFKPYNFKIVANIPYYLSGMLFRIFLESDVQPSDLVFLVQKEVAERIARDKKESLLSLSVKVFGDPHYVRTVGKGNFTPQPKIDSAIIAIRNISNERLIESGVSREQFFTLIHHGFKSKRKQLLGNLTDMIRREELTHIFSTLELPLDIRGEDLSLDMWLRLCHAIFHQN